MKENLIKESVDKKAFTLIEMLIVVLIVAILVAIALPQYRYAVQISKIKNQLGSLRPLMDAQERYYLATGAYTKDISELDVNVPYNSADLSFSTVGKYYTDWGQFSLLKGGSTIPVLIGGGPTVEGGIRIQLSSPKMRSTSFGSEFAPYNALCFAKSEGGKKLCIKMGGTLALINGTTYSYGINF